MGLAEADAGVNVERIEHHRIATTSFGDLARRRVRQRVGAADDKACKGQARIERRAAERIVIGGNRCRRRGAQLGRRTIVGTLDDTAHIDGRRRFLWRGCRPQGGAHGEIDPMHARHLGLPARQHALGIVGLDPALEEPRRNRQANAFILYGFEIHACEPARIDVLSDARAQPPLHARPTILFHV